MQAHDLFEFLRKLTKKDLKKFSAYMDVFKKTAKANLLLKYVMPHYPAFSQQELEAEKIYEHLFDNQYHAKYLSNVFSDLCIEFKKFIVILYQDEFSFEKDFMILQQFKQLGLGRFSEKHMTDMSKKISKEKNDSLWYWLKKMRLGFEEYYDPNKKQINIPSAKLYEILENLDTFYALAKLKIANEFYNRQTVLQEAVPDIKLLDQILKGDWYGKSITAHCYALSWQLFETKDDRIYKQLKKAVTEDIKELSAEDQYILLSYLINYNGRNYKGAKKVQGKDLFELYQYCIEGKFFIKEGIFNVDIFINIVDIASKMGNYTWLQKFVDKWSHLLPEKLKDETLLLSKAYYYFGKKEFGKAIEILAHNFKGVHNKIRFRLLLIASRYDDNYDWREIIENECKSTRLLAKRKKELNEATLTAVVNFTKIILMLNKIDPQKDKIKAKLEELDSIFFKNWLLQKVDELK